MKVLHVTFDGYHPENEFSIINIDKIDERFDKRSQYDSVDPTRTMLWSSNMWMRLYSLLEPKQAERYRPDEEEGTINVNTKYKLVPSENWIWNKLADKGVKSFIYPFYLLYGTSNDNFLDENSGNMSNVNAVIRKYNTPYYTLIEDGEVSSESSDYIYHGFHTHYDHALKDKPELYKEYKDMWDRRDSEELERRMPELVDVISENVDSKIVPSSMDNRAIQHEEIYPALDRVLAKENEDLYVHIGLGESDSLYHFNYPFPELMETMRDDYFDVIIDELLTKVDPDVFIVHGDHGMKEMFDHLPRRTKTEFEYGGKKYRTVKATWSICPFYLDHTNTVGGYVWVKENYDYVLSDLEKINSTPNEDGSPKLLLDSVHELLTNMDFTK